MFTLTENQDRAIVDLHNAAANSANQMDYGMACSITNGDDFEYELFAYGYGQIELRAYETRTKNPVIIDITLDMVTPEYDDIAAFIRENFEAGSMDTAKENFAEVWGKVLPKITGEEI